MRGNWFVVISCQSLENVLFLFVFVYVYAYDFQRQKHETPQVKLALQNQLNVVLLVGLNWFCTLGECLTLVSICF